MLYALSLCRNKHVAEDIVSTAFFRALQSVDHVTHFKAWLLAVVRNECFSLCRKRKRLMYDPPDACMLREEEDVCEAVLREEEYKALYRAIRLLPETQREVIELFYFSGMSISDIAGITEKSEGNVKVILHRARKKLKEMLEEGTT